MSWPGADVDVDEALVRSLLSAQHPDLAGRVLVEVGAGWDNVLWRLGDDLAVRLPRRAEAAPLALHEQRWLAALAPALPLPVPAPVRIGRPQGPYPWSWSVVPWLAGRPADTAPLVDPAASAGALGRFLRALHRVAPPDAPFNPYRGVALHERGATFEERLSSLSGHLDTGAVRRLWTRGLEQDPWDGPGVWLHGDLHPANVLLVDGSVAAVVDFGDLCAGDPATDVAGAWMLLPLSAVEVFSDAYGGMDGALTWRSVGWALLFSLMLLEIGLRGRPSYEAVGRTTVTRLLDYASGAP